MKHAVDLSILCNRVCFRDYSTSMTAQENECHSKCFDNFYAALLFCQNKFFTEATQQQWHPDPYRQLLLVMNMIDMQQEMITVGSPGQQCTTPDPKGHLPVRSASAVTLVPPMPTLPALCLPPQPFSLVPAVLHWTIVAVYALRASNGNALANATVRGGSCDDLPGNELALFLASSQLSSI